MKNVQFEQTRKAPQSKQRDLKRKGMGNKPNASAALSEEDIQVLFEKDLLGSSTAEALLNTVWLNNIIHFKLLGCKEHRQMCSRGDVKLFQNFHRAGVPRIQWKTNQNSFKKRSTECKSHCTENVFCAEQPEMSSKSLQSLRRKATRGNGNQRCTVYFDSKQCKIWQQRRAANWYYATVRTQKRSKYHSVLYRLTETTVEYESHSRWIEFRRNSSLIWLFYSGEKKYELDELTYLTSRTTFSQQSKQAAQQPLSLFSGAVISGGHIGVAINTLNQSPTLSVWEENPSKTYKRIKPLDSDSYWCLSIQACGSS